MSIRLQFTDTTGAHYLKHPITGEFTLPSNLKSLTILLWIRFTVDGTSFFAQGDDRPLAARGDNAVSGYSFLCYLFRPTEYNVIVARIQLAVGITSYTTDTTVNLGDMAWHHLGFVVRDPGGGANLRGSIYIDGVKRTLSSGSYEFDTGVTVIANNSYPLYIGRDNDVSIDIGLLRNVKVAQARLWTAALSDSEITTEMRSGRARSRLSSLLLDARYESTYTEGTAIRTNDYSSQARHGDLSASGGSPSGWSLDEDNPPTKSSWPLIIG